MAFCAVNEFNFNYKRIIMDEIALQGLEGIGLKLLWSFVEHRIKQPITDKMLKRFWSVIVASENITFYTLPTDAKYYEILDRFRIVDKESGNLKVPIIPPTVINLISRRLTTTIIARTRLNWIPYQVSMGACAIHRRLTWNRDNVIIVIPEDDYLDGNYDYHPIPNEYGSCEHYNTRILIEKTKLVNMPYEAILNNYGEKLVIVASLKERWHALAPHLPYEYLKSFSPTHFILLESIGRGRENGQMTIGKTNLTKISKDPKFLFYFRKRLEEHCLICNIKVIQAVDKPRGLISILIRLTRFYTPLLFAAPKEGILSNTISYLKGIPEHKETKANLQALNLVGGQKIWKKIVKKVHYLKFGKSDGEKTEVGLNTESDDSVSSEDESDQKDLKCQYRIGVNILRQAYERILESGLKGMSQLELGKVLGVNFYMSRGIFRMFKAKKVVTEFMEDKGRQRTTKYVAVAAIGDKQNHYNMEKEIFMKYLKEPKESYHVKIEVDEGSTSPIASSSAELAAPNDDVIPSKKRRLDSETIEDNNPIQANISEVDFKDNMHNTSLSETFLMSTKSPTLRQLKYANAIIKIVREKEIINGKTELNNLIFKEVGLSPMDSKSFKRFVAKLAADGQLRVYNLFCPGYKCNKNYVFCAPHIKKNHQTIVDIYKKMIMHVNRIQEDNVRKQRLLNNPKPKCQSLTVYGRFVKVRELHKFLFNALYLSSEKDLLRLYNLPEGYSSLSSVITEMPLSLAIGLISVRRIHELDTLSIGKCNSNSKLGHIPVHLSQKIQKFNGFTACLKTTIETLVYLGLIQVCFSVESILNNTNDQQRLIFYVNRKAKILDTQGDWPRDNVDYAALEKTFNFKTMDDVQTYWTSVQDISTNTCIKLEKRTRNSRLIIPNRSIEENYDDDIIIGDRMGPGGFNSSLFLEIPQFWHVHSVFASKKIRDKYSRPKAKVSVAVKRAPVKKVIVKQPKILTKPESRGVPQRLIRIRNPKNAMIWTKWEDRVMLLVKVAISIMSPSIQCGYAQVTHLVAKDLLSLGDGRKKTVSHCMRHAKDLDKIDTFKYSKQQIMNDVKRVPSVLAKYEGLLRKIRLRHSNNLGNYLNEARLKCMELVWLLEQISQSDLSKSLTPCIALDMEEFDQHFKLTDQVSELPYNVYNTTSDNSIELNTVKEGIMLVVNLPSLTEDMSMKVFNTFKFYPEIQLRSCTDLLQKICAISLKDKSGISIRLNYKNIMQHSSMFKVSSLYTRRWSSRFNSDFIDNILKFLESSPSNTNIKASPEICCFLCELQSLKAVKIQTGVKPRMIGDSHNELSDLEIRSKFKSGTLGWKKLTTVNRMKDLYRDICYGDAVITLVRNATALNVGKTDINIEGPLLTALEAAGEKGMTFGELQIATNVPFPVLHRMISTKEKEHVLKRVGYQENVIVLCKYLKPWCLNINKEHLIPAPWFLLGTKIIYHTFIQFSSAIMNKIFECPGSSIVTLSRFLEFITCRNVLEICIFLQKCKCVTLHTLKQSEVSLFSDNDYDESITILENFSQYMEMDSIVVFPVKDCILKFANLKAEIKPFCIELTE